VADEKKISTRMSVCFMVAIALIVGAGTTPALAAGPEETPAAGPSEGRASESTDRITRTEVRFDHPVTLDDAIKADKPVNDSPVAYRIEGSGVVAEWAPQAESEAAFSAGFRKSFGIEPQVVGYLVEVRLPSVDAAARAGTLPVRRDTVAVDAPEFRSAEVPAENREALSGSGSGVEGERELDSAADATAAAEPTLRAAALSTQWWARSARFELYRLNGYQYFYSTLTFGASGQEAIPSGFGMEVGIDLYNDATGSRGGVPICGPGFRDAFIAKNYNWTSWQAFSPDGDVSAARPYADYNDLLDPCNRNSFAIGFQYGDKLTGTQLSTVIQAPTGNTATSRIGASLQLVDNNACTPIESSGEGGATDCMGILERTPDGVEPAQIMLAAESRTVSDYTACWDTVVSGGVPKATWKAPADCNL
jgi:hypothetical protein